MEVGQQSDAKPAQRLRQTRNWKRRLRELEVVALVQEPVRGAAGRRSDGEAGQAFQQAPAIEEPCAGVSGHEC
jgi:hypothetical protein